MKKKLFDAKIYLEGLRQTRVMGLFLSIAIVGISALAPLFSIMTSFTMALLDVPTSTMIDLSSFTPFLSIFMFLGPILLSMHLFSFLNKRNGSDFYHALPCTRTCLLVSFSASIVTWLAGTILATTLVNGLLYAVCPITNILWSFIPYSFFTYFCGSLLVLAVMLIAKSMTGTGISNIVVAMLIGFGPRALILIFVSVLNEMVPIADVSSMGFFLNNAYNIPVNMILGPMDDTSFSFIPGMITTVVLAMLYFVIAWKLFQTRKSETAQKSAPNRVMQHIIRCLITIPITLLIPIGIVQGDVLGAFFSSFAILVIAAIIYFGYELLSTRKAKNLLYALPVFGVVLLFDVLFGVALVGTEQALLKVPETSEIKAVSVSVQEADYYGLYSHYNMLLTEEYFVEDEGLIQLVNDALQDTVQYIKEDTYYDKLYMYSEDDSYYSCPVSIQKKNGSVIKRNILLRYDAMDEVLAVYEKNEGYLEQLAQMPNQTDIQQIEFYEYGLGPKETDEVWKVFCEEYASLPYEKQLLANGIGSFYEGSQWDDTSLRKITFCVYGYYGITSYQVEYTISANTPKTYQAYLEAVNQCSQKYLDDFFKEVDEIAAGKNDSVNYDFHCQDSRQEAYYMSGAISSSGIALHTGKDEAYTYDEVQEMFSILENAAKRPVDLTQPLYELNADRYDDGYLDTFFVTYFNLTEAELEALKPYMELIASTEIPEDAWVY